MIKCANFFKYFVSVAMVFAVINADAAVAKRGTVSRAKVTAAARAPVVATTAVAVTQADPEPEVIVEETVVTEEPFEFEDRTSQFDDAIGGVSASGASDDDELAEMIRRQRAASDASDATETVRRTTNAMATSGQNACDMGLRKCMQAKCGADFAKCAGDTDTIWGDKMDACRRDIKCSGAEYAAFVPEIKADRDANAELANYNAIINCGNKYNSCILAECGATFSKCLGKSYGDAAIAKCRKIQNECTGLDNGLASRMMNVFAGVRQDAEKQVQRDEQRLYDLRDEMAAVCRKMGAMFDQRSLDCVYTVNFFADNATTPYASKKAYAGGVFSCDPGWFGIDVTTFKENAYRLTREQKSASSAMLGSGIGMAAGAITSGAIDRALETQKAKKELKKAEAGDEETLESDKEKNKSKDKTDEVTGENEDDSKPGAAGRRCVEAGGKWENGACAGATCDDGKKWDSSKNKCVKDKELDESEKKSEEGDNKDEEKDDSLDTAEVACGDKGGAWGNGKCSCKNKKGKDITTTNPVKDCVKPSEAGSKNDGKKESSEPADDKKKNVLSENQKKACTSKGGTLNTDFTLCLCKDRYGRSVETDNPIKNCVKPKEDKKSAEAVPAKADSQGADNKGNANISTKEKCEIDVSSRYNVLNIPRESRYNEILAQLRQENDDKIAVCVDTPVGDSGLEFSCSGTGQPTCIGKLKSGEKPKDKVDENCWACVCGTSEVVLKNKAREQFIDEKVKQECE